MSAALSDSSRSTRLGATAAWVALATSIAIGACSKESPVEPRRVWRVEGTLRFEGGRAAPVVYVYLSERLFPVTNSPDLYLARALTDVAGRFAFTDVPAGAFGLYASGPADTLVGGTPFQLGVAAPGGSTRDVPLTLARPGTFRGAVHRFGAANHSNIAVQLSGAPLLIAETDSAGLYTMPGIPPGEWTVAALSLDDDYAPDSATGHIAAPGDSARLRDMLLRPLPVPERSTGRTSAGLRGRTRSRGDS